MTRRRRLPSRRAFLGAAAAGVAGLAALRLLFPRWMRPGPVQPVDELSEPARALVRRAFEGVERSKMWDGHAHLVGLGTGGTGCRVNPEMSDYTNLVGRLQFDVYMAASGVDDLERADAQYLERLLALHRAFNPEGKLLLLAFDGAVDEAGAEFEEGTAIYTPDDYVLRIAAENADVEACISVHPNRPDALERLEQGSEAGARAVKWLPNSMGIDPASSRNDPFYRRLAELGLPLLTHAGKELAVHAEAGQELGNPLRLRRPLDAGVRVVVAHCAGLGTSRDLDVPGEPQVPCFELFMRLMGERSYEENLFGEVSAMTVFNRSGDPLREILAARELHPRLVNGSDYPIPAIEMLVSPWLLEQRGFLRSDELGPLEEIFEANPLLFDFVVKRCLTVETSAGPVRFDPVVFETARVYGPS